jgi:hypothetical protein
VTSDPRSRDPFQPGAGPDDATASYPAPTPAEPAPAAAPSAWAAPAGAVAGTDPFDRPLDRSVTAAPIQAPVQVAVVRSRGGGLFLNMLLGIALVVAVGGVAFAAGRATAPVATASGRTGFGGNGGVFQGGPNASGAPGGALGAGGGFGAGGLSIQGTVTAISATSITLQLEGGQTVTIPIDAQTTYAQRTPTTAAAVTSGSTVAVQVQGGRGAFGNGNGNGGQGNGANASGAPGRTLGPALSITVIPPAS